MKFNLNAGKTKKTANHEGAQAFVFTPELELYTTSASLDDRFNAKKAEWFKRMHELLVVTAR